MKNLEVVKCVGHTCVTLYLVQVILSEPCDVHVVVIVIKFCVFVSL